MTRKKEVRDCELDELPKVTVSLTPPTHLR